jgi:hypothetical protein
MPCDVRRLPDGSVAICCSRGAWPKHQACYVCGARSEFLCDWPVTRRAIGVGPKEYPNITDGTCDKRMCRRCANEVGPDRHYCNAHFRLSRTER